MVKLNMVYSHDTAAFTPSARAIVDIIDHNFQDQKVGVAIVNLLRGLPVFEGLGDGELRKIARLFLQRLSAAASESSAKAILARKPTSSCAGPSIFCWMKAPNRSPRLGRTDFRGTGVSGWGSARGHRGRQPAEYSADHSADGIQRSGATRAAPGHGRDSEHRHGVVESASPDQSGGDGFPEVITTKPARRACSRSDSGRRAACASPRTRAAAG